MRLTAISMVRNEGDIINAFLRHCAEFFDELIVADVCSTDGTAAALRNFSDPRLRLTVRRVERPERYQGALLDLMSRQAFEGGAEWVFCLDGDEFIDVGSRAELEQSVRDLGADVMKMPWLNLVPSKFGAFNSFDMAQDFHWSGRASPFSKVAISRLYAANHPEYCIQEGSHAVSPSFGEEANPGRAGTPLLHIPIRCRDRLHYKITRGLRLVRAKHNRLPGEGNHADALVEMLQQGTIGVPELRQLAATYGERPERLDGIDPEALGWPVRRLPAFMHESELGRDSHEILSLPKTLAADEAMTWRSNEFVPHSRVGALLQGDCLQIVPQVLRGNGSARRSRFGALPPARIPERFEEGWLTEIVAASTNPIPLRTRSAWTQLVPILYALMTLLRPRRYVELGVHNGMSFFAACDIAKKNCLPVECVAVDSWLGDEHASFHDASVFSDFRGHIAARYPNQYFVQGYFASVLDCFDESSVDLLHIDGFHTYEAVKEDFDTWLPKMSEVGVIIFHDTNEFGRNFGVWRLWEELMARYPAFEFAHQHGLGVVYVGKEPHPFAALLRRLAESRQDRTLAQAYFGAIGTLLTEGTPLPTKTGPDWSDLQARYDAVINSTSWRMTAPLRAVLNRLPALRLFLRRVLKSLYWIATGQFSERYRLYRQVQAEAARRPGS